MEDDRSRLTKPLITRWNLILQDILDEDESTEILSENHKVIHQSFDELSKNLQYLSQLRHHLNCRLEFIKSEVDNLNLNPQNSESGIQQDSESRIQNLKEEGLQLQMELEDIEKRLKKLRQSQSEKSM